MNLDATLDDSSGGAASIATFDERLDALLAQCEDLSAEMLDAAAALAERGQVPGRVLLAKLVRWHREFHHLWRDIRSDSAGHVTASGELGSVAELRAALLTVNDARARDERRMAAIRVLAE